MGGNEAEGEKPKRPSMFGASKPNSLKTLRAAYRDRLDFSDMEGFTKELSGESDRASVILVAAHLEDILAFEIANSRAFEVRYSADFDWMFRQEGPMGTFSHKMEIACLFGVIEDETYRQLNIIREMRNICAHSRRTISFRDPTIENFIKRLFAPELSLVNPRWAEECISKGETKRAFVLEVLFIAIVLSHASREKARKIIQEMYLRVVSQHTPPPDKRREP